MSNASSSSGHEKKERWETVASGDYERTKLQVPSAKSASGRWLYLPGDLLKAALGGELPDELYADRLLLDRGKRQILLRLYDDQK